jgi:hypothetical protein
MGQDGPRTAEKWRIRGTKEVHGRLSIMTATLSLIEGLFDGGWGLVNGGSRLVDGGRKVVSSELPFGANWYRKKQRVPIMAMIFETLGTPEK